jgi:hypothetical protein
MRLAGHVANGGGEGLVEVIGGKPIVKETIRKNRT